MKLPTRCPWCHAPVLEVVRFKSMPRRSVVYECGTRLEDYPAIIQVVTPCEEVSQWIRPEQWTRILKRSRKAQ